MKHFSRVLVHRLTMKLRLAFFCVASAAVSFAAAPAATSSAPIMMKAADRVPWGSLAELESFAARGDLKACAQLGHQLLTGDDFPKDVPRALTLLERAARGGVGSAIFRLGMILDDDQIVPQDRVRALAYFRAAAAAGEAEGFFNVGAAYVGAHGVKRDYAEGLAWLILAAKRGAGADTEKTVRARIQKLGHPEWIAAAEARAPAIARELAATTAVALLPSPAPLTAINGGDTTTAEPATGPPVKLTLSTGRRVSYPDFAALERAAERNAPGAIPALGRVLIEGQLTPADPARAVTLLERAAQAGSPDAAHELAELYTNGKIPRDTAKAFTYNLQAARGGSLQAMFNTGALYANGTGTARDFGAALTWLIVAKHYGLDRGGTEGRIRAHVEKTAPAEIAVAEKRAAEFQREIDNAKENPARP